MSTRTKFDAVIIGSGAGGSPIAHELVRRGRSVLVLEKGPLLRAQGESPRGLSDFKRDELFATGAEKRIQLEVANKGRSYYSSHVEPDLNDEPHVYRTAQGTDEATIEGYTAQLVGGGTHLYGGVSLRFSEMDFRLRSFNEGRVGQLRDDPGDEVRREARDWPISYADLEPYYCKAERLVGINGTSQNQAKPFSADYYQKPLPPNSISRYVERGMDSLGMARYRTPLAVITEPHEPSARNPAEARTAFVNRYGDPLGLKSNTWVSLLRPISKLEELELRPNCHVTHLGCDSGGRVTRVHYRDPAGLERVVEGTVVVVACSAIESVRLLLLSAEEDGAFSRRIHASGLLGRYFLTHCFGGAEFKLDEQAEGRFDKSISLDSDWATDHCAREEFIRAQGLWAGGAIYNNTSDQALPLSLARTHGSADLDTVWDVFVNDPGLTGEALLGFLDENFGTRLSVSYMANQVPWRDNRIELHPSVRDKWGRKAAYILKQWHRHDHALMDVMARQCRAILEASGAKYEEIEHGSATGWNRIANHILGGARFGTDPADSVLDPQCRAWEFDNLYVTDGSFMPTSGGANPTLTIQANAFRVADHLLTRF
ncbi:MAG TPA: GMC family oxidoreductase [Myxococcus sp.]|nr:GMC family oxidoreductase [Myxococcus sp.]